MSQINDLSRSATPFDQGRTLVLVVEMSVSTWLAAAMAPGVARAPLYKLDPDADQLLKLITRWREEALAAGCAIGRVALAYEAGRDGFWLARWLRERDVEAYAIHPSSVAASRERRRAKTDRLATQLLMRAFLGWNQHTWIPGRLLLALSVSSCMRSIWRGLQLSSPARSPLPDACPRCPMRRRRRRSTARLSLSATQNGLAP